MPTINGFTVVQYGDPALATYAVGDRGARLSVRREVAPLLVGFMTDYSAAVEPIMPGNSWGHAPKQIPGSTSWSFHAPGIAVDLNSHWHPEYKRGTFRQDQVGEIRRLLAKYSYAGKSLFRWGGDYKNHGDEMHFELIQSRTNCLAAVRLLQTAPTVWYTGPAGSRLVKFINPLMCGDDVKVIQRAASGVVIDGYYGPKTEASVKIFQASRNLVADGEVGPKTWAYIPH
jgi:hypothetical protein